jgi:hypothetical protein
MLYDQTVAKLSSSKTMSAASLVMAVPLMPIAIQSMLALLGQGIIYSVTGHRYKLIFCL